MKEISQIENFNFNFSEKFDKKLINLIPKKISSKHLYNAMKYIIDVGGKT